MSTQDDPTRRLLAPRRLEPKPAPPVRHALVHRRRWWLAGVGAALVLGVVAGVRFWHPSAAPPPIFSAPAAAVAAGPAPANRPSTPEASVAELLAAPKGGDWRLRRLRENPAIFVIEFPGLTEQGKALNRLAAMYEKRGGRLDRPLSETEMLQLLQSSGDSVASFYQGHDYTAEQLARFFTLAAALQVPLSAQEGRLRAALLDNGVMAAQGAGTFSAIGLQAVISFSAVQRDDPATAPDETVDAVRRESILLHELSHGTFFTSASYRTQCWDFWRNQLSERERQMFRHYLDGLEYNPRDEELMVNETQAVLMHTPDTRAFNAAALGVPESELVGLRARFRRVLTPLR